MQLENYFFFATFFFLAFSHVGNQLIVTVSHCETVGFRGWCQAISACFRTNQQLSGEKHWHLLPHAKTLLNNENLNSTGVSPSSPAWSEQLPHGHKLSPCDDCFAATWQLKFLRGVFWFWLVFFVLVFSLHAYTCDGPEIPNNYIQNGCRLSALSGWSLDTWPLTFIYNHKRFFLQNAFFIIFFWKNEKKKILQIPHGGWCVRTFKQTEEKLEKRSKFWILTGCFFFFFFCYDGEALVRCSQPPYKALSWERREW